MKTEIFFFHFTIVFHEQSNRTTKVTELTTTTEFQVYPHNTMTSQQNGNQNAKYAFPAHYWTWHCVEINTARKYKEYVKIMLESDTEEGLPEWIMKRPVCMKPYARDAFWEDRLCHYLFDTYVGKCELVPRIFYNLIARGTLAKWFAKALEKNIQNREKFQAVREHYFHFLQSLLMSHEKQPQIQKNIQLCNKILAKCFWSDPWRPHT